MFHAKGKQQLWGCTQEPGDLPPDVRDTLQRATGFYEYVLLSSKLKTTDGCSELNCILWSQNGFIVENPTILIALECFAFQKLQTEISFKLAIVSLL